LSYFHDIYTLLDDIAVDVGWIKLSNFKEIEMKILRLDLHTVPETLMMENTLFQPCPSEYTYTSLTHLR